MSVSVGWLDGGTTSGAFTDSVTKLCAYEAAKGRLVSVMRIQSGPILEDGRNKLVAGFLHTPAEWLLMVDADMVFSHDAAEMLAQHAMPDTRPVVGGLCFGVNQELGQFPTMYARINDIPVVQRRIPESDLVQVDGTGAAFLLIHRSVFDVRRPDPTLPWFHRRHVPSSGDHPGGTLGEDLSWCWWLGDNNIPVHVATQVEVGHVKDTIVDYSTYVSP